MSLTQPEPRRAVGGPDQQRGWFLEQPWGRMRVWQMGRGPTLLAVHGLGGSGRYWSGLSQRISGYTVIAPDLGGFGESSKPDAPYDIEFHLASLDVLVDHVAPSERITLVGHSIGGVVAAAWAAKHPHRVASLVLITTPFPGLHPLPSALRWVREKPRSWSRRIPVNLARAVIYPILVPVVLARGYGLSNLRDYTRQSLAARTRTAWSLMADSTTAKQLARLEDLPSAADALLLTGSADRLVTDRDTSEWTKLLPAAKRVSRAGGHQLLLHGGFAIVSDWLAEHLPSSREHDFNSPQRQR